MDDKHDVRDPRNRYGRRRAEQIWINRLILMIGLISLVFLVLAEVEYRKLVQQKDEQIQQKKEELAQKDARNRVLAEENELRSEENKLRRQLVAALYNLGGKPDLVASAGQLVPGTTYLMIPVPEENLQVGEQFTPLSNAPASMVARTPLRAAKLAIDTRNDRSEVLNTEALAALSATARPSIEIVTVPEKRQADRESQFNPLEVLFEGVIFPVLSSPIVVTVSTIDTVVKLQKIHV